MPGQQKMVINEAIRIDGAGYNYLVEQLFDNKTVISPLLTRGKTGTLTTRTDNTTGSATMESGHGITTGAKVSIYWYDVHGVLAGSRYNVTIGTVSGTTVPISNSGSGDNLPVATTALVMMVEQSESVLLTGNNVKAILAWSPVPATLHIMDDAGTPAIITTIELDADQVYRWYYDSGKTSPVAAVNITAVKGSHGDGVNSQAPIIIFGYN